MHEVIRSDASSGLGTFTAANIFETCLWPTNAQLHAVCHRVRWNSKSRWYSIYEAIRHRRSDVFSIFVLFSFYFRHYSGWTSLLDAACVSFNKLGLLAAHASDKAARYRRHTVSNLRLLAIFWYRSIRFVPTIHTNDFGRRLYIRTDKDQDSLSDRNKERESKSFRIGRCECARVCAALATDFWSNDACSIKPIYCETIVSNIHT